MKYIMPFRVVGRAVCGAIKGCKVAVGSLLRSSVQFSFLLLPIELQLEITRAMPLRDLAVLACMDRQLLAVLAVRLARRNAVVAALLQYHFAGELILFQGLSIEDTRLPRDFITALLVRETALPCSPLPGMRGWTVQPGHLLISLQGLDQNRTLFIVAPSSESLSLSICKQLTPI
jgi:hypothetical protein